MVSGKELLREVEGGGIQALVGVLFSLGGVEHAATQEQDAYTYRQRKALENMYRTKN